MPEQISSECSVHCTLTKRKEEWAEGEGDEGEERQNRRGRRERREVKRQEVK